ncbi:heme d1 biosynthesis radical SAM protein NirJ2 [Methanosarcinales archaeon]|nr:MAG: heme d1 biosynthesis radical SAM protein NirJ2 [Methanosarcinales archaeon]
MNINWNITAACNLRCSHCYYASHSREGELDTEEAINLLASIRSYFGSGTNITLGGGEPLMREDVYEIIQHGSKLGLNMMLGTNGTLITHSIASKLLDSGLKEVIISIDGMEECHDLIRGKGTFKRSIAGAKNCRDAGLSLVIDPCLMDENVDQLTQILNLCEELGARQCRVFHFVEMGRGGRNRAGSSLNLASYTKNLYDLYDEQVKRKHLEICTTQGCQYWVVLKQAEAEGKFIPDFYLREAPGCRAGIALLSIKPDGNVVPCPLLPVVIANVRDTSLDEIMRSEIIEKLRRRDVKGKCKVCINKDLCGGCRVRAYIASGDYLGEDPLCGEVFMR